MRKLFSIFAALTLCAGLWAETVPYIDATGASKTADATEITNQTSAFNLGTAGNTTWYVVKGENVTLSKGAVCNGADNIILADNAKLTATGGASLGKYTPGIQVSGEGNSLTIYGQDNHSGQLTANGGQHGAGIGGGNGCDGSNIIINGGTVTTYGGMCGSGIGGGHGGSGSNIIINGGIVSANGGEHGACIGGGKGGSGSNIIINDGTVTTDPIFAAGIGGGGGGGDGSNIIINGGKVTVTGDFNAAGIGGSDGGSGSNIFVATNLTIKADNNNPPTTVITNTGGDLASSLAGKRYVNIEIDIPSIRTAAIDEINKAIEGVTDADVHAIATTAITDINNATSEEQINSIKTFALTKINAIAAITAARQGIKDTELNNWIDAAIKEIKIGSQDATPSIDDIKDQILTIIRYFQNGKAEGIADANAALPSDAQDAAGHTVTITKGEKTLKLVNPDKVTFGKQE